MHNKNLEYTIIDSFSMSIVTDATVGDLRVLEPKLVLVG
jgi:hypothetical protein